MKKMTAILGLVLMSSTVFASGLSKLESYECGLQVGKSLIKLENTPVRQDVVILSEDIANYSAQTKLLTTLKKKSEKNQVAQAANNSWQSIVYSLGNIKDVSADEAAAINTACDLKVGQ